MTDFEQLTMNCPKCGKEYEDFDGVGERRRAEHWIREWRERSKGFDILHGHYLTACQERDQARIESSKAIMESGERVLYFAEANEKLRAELEALRAPLPDAELAEIEKEFDQEYEQDSMKAEAYGGARVATLLRALRAERARVKVVEQQWRDLFDSSAAEQQRRFEREEETLALLSSCRPVVEAVLEFREAGWDTPQWHALLHEFRTMSLPTLPEPPK